MDIKYKANKKELKNINKIEAIDFAINAFLSYWNIQNEPVSLTVDLQSKELSDPEAIAGAYKQDDLNYVIHINKEFKGPIIDLFTVLAHEIVHIKQYIKNELIKELFINEDGEWEIYTEWLGLNVSGLSYEKRPYEFEANQYQNLMVEELFKEIDMISSVLES